MPKRDKNDRPKDQFAPPKNLYDLLTRIQGAADLLKGANSLVASNTLAASIREWKAEKALLRQMLLPEPPVQLRKSRSPGSLRRPVSTVLPHGPEISNALISSLSDETLGLLHDKLKRDVSSMSDLAPLLARIEGEVSRRNIVAEKKRAAWSPDAEAA